MGCTLALDDGDADDEAGAADEDDIEDGDDELERLRELLPVDVSVGEDVAAPAPPAAPPVVVEDELVLRVELVLVDDELVVGTAPPAPAAPPFTPLSSIEERMLEAGSARSRTRRQEISVSVCCVVRRHNGRRWIAVRIVHSRAARDDHQRVSIRVRRAVKARRRLALVLARQTWLSRRLRCLGRSARIGRNHVVVAVTSSSASVKRNKAALAPSAQRPLTGARRMGPCGASCALGGPRANPRSRRPAAWTCHAPRRFISPTFHRPASWTQWRPICRAAAAQGGARLLQIAGAGPVGPGAVAPATPPCRWTVSSTRHETSRQG